MNFHQIGRHAQTQGWDIREKRTLFALFSGECKDTFTYYDNLCVDDIADYKGQQETVYEYVSEMACEQVNTWNITMITTAQTTTKTSHILKPLIWVYLSKPLNTWHNNNVVITPKRRHFDVIVSKCRRFDVITTSLLRNMAAGRQYNCWSLRCRRSMACRLCSNYMFILDITHDFNRLSKGNCKTKRETLKFGDLMHLILEFWRYVGMHTLTRSRTHIHYIIHIDFKRIRKSIIDF